jgi:membrane protease subunit HflC
VAETLNPAGPDRLTGPASPAADRAIDRLRRGLGLVLVLALAARAASAPVREGSAAIITRFGDPVRVLDTPGLHPRLPWPAEEAVLVDLRARTFSTAHTEMLTRDKKNVILVGFAVWRVADPLRFHQAVGGVEAAEQKLDGLVTNAQIGVLGGFDLAALTSTDPSTLQLEVIEAALREAVGGMARDQYGIEVLDMGFSRLSLPEENVAVVFRQMKAERKQYAAKHQAEGDEVAARIRAEADLAAAQIRAEGEAEAARIRGEAEAEAARIYAAAHGQDPDLYRFVRSLDSLDAVVGSQTTVILRTDSAPFRLLAGPGGQGG